MQDPVVIKIFKNGDLVMVKQFVSPQIAIGSIESAQIFLEGNEIQPLHAVIENNEGIYSVMDLGSESGTYIGEEKIVKNNINSGEIIGVGDYDLHFYIGLPTVLSDISPSRRRLKQQEANKPAVSEPVINKPVVSEPIVNKPAANKSAPVIEKETIEEPAAEVAAPLPMEPVTATSVEPEVTQPIAEKSKKSPAPTIETVVAAGGAVVAKTAKIMPVDLVPGDGNIIEVLVTWGDRVISADFYDEKSKISVGTDKDCDIIFPLSGKPKKVNLIDYALGAKVSLSNGSQGNYVSGKENYSLSNYLMSVGHTQGQYQLPKGDMISLEGDNEDLRLNIRYTDKPPVLASAPPVDFSATEVTGIILALMVSALFSLYMFIYKPVNLEDDANLQEELLRKVVIEFNAPKPRPRPAIVEPLPEPPKEPVKIVKVSDKPKKTVAQKAKSIKKAGKPGVAQGLKKIKEPKKTNEFGSQKKQGGAVKTSEKSGASAASEKPDPTNSGILGVFGSGGAQSELAKAYDGSGALIGDAEGATGSSGFGSNREGQGLGGKLKQTGGSGTGNSSVGVPDVGTNGRGAGGTGYGTGGLGSKGRATVTVAGSDGTFGGGMDRGAVLRAIRSQRRQIQFCYERELRSDSSLEGTIKLRWLINAGGKASGFKTLANDFGSSKIPNCVTRVLNSIVYPEPPPGSAGEVSIPFTFGK